MTVRTRPGAGWAILFVVAAVLYAEDSGAGVLSLLLVLALACLAVAAVARAGRRP